MHPEDITVFAKELIKFISENKREISELKLDVDFDNILLDVHAAIDRAEEESIPDNMRIGYYGHNPFTGGKY